MPLPRIDLLDFPVLQREHAKGTLVRCGPGLRPVAWPESPRTRLMALGLFVWERAAVTRFSAAWVWGAAAAATDPFECVVTAVYLTRFGGIQPDHPNFPQCSVTYRTTRMKRSECVWFCNRQVGVTNVSRTLYDLCRDSTFLPPHRAAIRLLRAKYPQDYMRLIERVQQSSHPVHVRCATRLRDIFGDF